MKKILLVVWAVIFVSMAGCVGNQKAILKATAQTRQDVFQEVQSSQTVPGKVSLRIEFPIKNFKARFVTTYVKHSDPAYTAIVNIDGQPVELTDEPVLEDLPGDFKKNPEAGTGWKYNFKKELLLEPGKHHVTIAVPLSDVVTEKDVTLNAGVNLMLLSPVYNASVSRYPNYPRFSHGLRMVTVELNNQEL